MKKTAQILTLAIASLLGLGAISMASRTGGAGQTGPDASPTITVYYGDVAVSLPTDRLEMSFDPAALVH